jgi:hypothetical protein
MTFTFDNLKADKVVNELNPWQEEARRRWAEAEQMYESQRQNPLFAGIDKQQYCAKYVWTFYRPFTIAVRGTT